MDQESTRVETSQC